MNRPHPVPTLHTLLAAALLLLCGPLVAPVALEAQAGAIAVALPDGESATLRVETHRGYPAIPAESLEPLAWDLERRAGSPAVMIRHRTGLALTFVPGSPVMSWDGRLVQMVHSPYWVGDAFYLPVQLVTDLLPGFLPDAYAFDASTGRLAVEGAVAASAPLGRLGDFDRPASTGDPAAPTAAGEPDPATPDALDGAPPEPRAPRIVVIDPGHGGDDPGAIGDGGLQEKDLALAIALALRRELADDPDLEVRLTRDRDELVPLWDRGELATEWKGDRPGVFVSIHANALPDRTGVRGFETYFLSEARTEHERRVAAAENASVASEIRTENATTDPLLGQILTDLRTFDHQHWSALLAEEVQRELGSFHPGPDRGVKQGPLAVITNSLMPSVLVEIGFITNPQEARALTRPEFHSEAAAAMARAIDRFFERYPPGEAP